MLRTGRWRPHGGGPAKRSTRLSKLEASTPATCSNLCKFEMQGSWLQFLKQAHATLPRLSGARDAFFLTLWTS